MVNMSSDICLFEGVIAALWILYDLCCSPNLVNVDVHMDFHVLGPTSNLRFSRWKSWMGVRHKSQPRVQGLQRVRNLATAAFLRKLARVLKKSV